MRPRPCRDGIHWGLDAGAPGQFPLRKGDYQFRLRPAPLPPAAIAPHADRGRAAPPHSGPKLFHAVGANRVLFMRFPRTLAPRPAPGLRSATAPLRGERGQGAATRAGRSRQQPCQRPEGRSRPVLPAGRTLGLGAGRMPRTSPARRLSRGRTRAAPDGRAPDSSSRRICYNRPVPHALALAAHAGGLAASHRVRP